MAPLLNGIVFPSFPEDGNQGGPPAFISVKNPRAPCLVASASSTTAGMQINDFSKMSVQQCQRIEKLKNISALPGCVPEVGFQTKESLQAVVPVGRLNKVMEDGRLHAPLGTQNIDVNTATPSVSPEPSSSKMMQGCRQALGHAEDNAGQMARAEGLELGPMVKISQGVNGKLLSNPNSGGLGTVGAPFRQCRSAADWCKRHLPAPLNAVRLRVKLAGSHFFCLHTAMAPWHDQFCAWKASVRGRTVQLSSRVCSGFSRGRLNRDTPPRLPSPNEPRSNPASRTPALKKM